MQQDLLCKHCKRYLGKTYGSIVAEIKCSNSSCRATNQFKVINGDQVSDMRFKFATPEQLPKKKDVEVS